ncbi:GNAT family N-acetyltransferase [Hymenobacter terrenus]|uniref:GNAT family N-acetyltransferase n=1 Tax=Hymenobacter terrenus TaxID=1629124 RepID=UPI000619DDC6|nr:GNAT family protein [Hymenobacter terrenus]
MNPFPRLETERLILSELRPEDIPVIVAHASNKRISDYTLNLPYPYSDKDAVYWLNQANQGYKSGTHYLFGMRLKPEQPFIGGIGLTVEPRFSRAEIGYWLAEPYWDQGYTTEATKAIIAFGFEQLGLNKLTSSHISLNPGSGRVMTKAGLVKEGELAEHISKQGVYYDLVVYGLTRTRYQQL